MPFRRLLNMTCIVNIFKYFTLLMLFACSQDSSTNPQLDQLSSIQKQSLELEKRALSIESQIDELRRSNAQNQEKHREQLQLTIKQFEIDFEVFESNLNEWKQQLIVHPNNAQPVDVIVAPKHQTEYP